MDATAARQTALESQFVAQLAQLNSVQNVNVHYVDPTQLSSTINKKKENSQRQVRRVEKSEQEVTVYDGNRAVVAMELLAEWENLAERLGFNRARDRVMIDSDEMEFRTVFRDEIDTVRRVRNSVAHNVYVDDTILKNALAAARQLNTILTEEYSRPQ